VTASFELHYLYFFNGLAFFLLAATVFYLRPGPADRASWFWLALAALAACVDQWLDMLSPGFGPTTAFRAIQLAAAIVPFVALVEFGRRSLPSGGHPARNRRLAWLTSPWLYLPLGIVAATGGFSGQWSGVEATCRWAFGLPGALLAGAVLWRASQRCGVEERTGFRLAAAALWVYALSAGAIVPEAAFFPASALHEDAFRNVAGIPVDIARAACAWVAMAGLWLVRCARLDPKLRPGRLQRWMAPAACAVVLGLGWTTTAWDFQVVDGQFAQSASSGGSDAGAASQSTTTSQEQSPQAASKEVTLPRQRTGMSTIVLVLLVQGVIASLCLLAYRFSR
jgi:hypothetical protein